MTDIVDGTAQTACFSERCKGDYLEYQPYRPGDILWGFGVSTPKHDWPWQVPASMKGSAGDALQTTLTELCRNVNPSGMYDMSIAGYRWAQIADETGAYNHVLPPNSWGCCFFWAKFIGDSIIPPSSYHDGMVNVLMCDGSVSPISEKIDLPTWKAMGTRAGGEVINAGSF